MYVKDIKRGIFGNGSKLKGITFYFIKKKLYNINQIHSINTLLSIYLSFSAIVIDS